MKKWILIAAGIALGAVALAALVGSFFPRAHVTSLALRLNRGPSEVWTVVTAYAESPQWRKDLQRVERLADQDGKPVWKETYQDGWAITLADDAAIPPTMLIRRIADPDLPFSGAWTYEIRAEEGGSTVRITERGEVANPLFRLMSGLSDQSATIRAYLAALAARFGETPRIAP